MADPTEPTDPSNGRGGSRPGSGRPPLPKARKRRHKVMIAVTTAELAQLEKAVESVAQDKSLAVYVREAALAASKRRPRRKKS